MEKIRRWYHWYEALESAAEIPKWLKRVWLLGVPVALTIWQAITGPHGALFVGGVLFFFSVALFSYVGFLELKKLLGAKPHAAPKQGPVDELALMKQLKPIAGDQANVKFLVANMNQEPLMDTLISVFRLAGWDVSPRPNQSFAPLETFIHNHLFEGIEVLGYNKSFVETVSRILGDAKIPSIRTKIEDTHVKPDNPKWAYIQHSIRITIGRH